MNIKIILRKVLQPTAIYGRQLGLSNARLRHNTFAGIITVWGIYLDRDVYVVKSLEPFLRFECHWVVTRASGGQSVDYRAPERPVP